MRFLKSLGFGILVWVASFPIFMFVSFALSSLIYPALLDWFPEIFPRYSFVNEREEYEAFYNMLSLVSSMLVAGIASYISVRYDNERMEYMITETEGMYTILEGAKIYYTHYFNDDVFASLIVPLPLILADAFLIPMISFLPDGVLSLIGVIFEPTRACIAAVGMIFAYFVIALVFFLSRMLSGIFAINAFRALWLSEIEYVG